MSVYVKIQEDYRVYYCHYNFDRLGDEEKGKFTGGYETNVVIPDPQKIAGKNEVLYYDPTQDIFYYEYIDRELTPEEKQLQEQQAQIDELTLQLGDLILQIQGGTV